MPKLQVYSKIYNKFLIYVYNIFTCYVTNLRLEVLKFMNIINSKINFLIHHSLISSLNVKYLI